MKNLWKEAQVYKVPKQYSSTNCLKSWKWDVYTYWEEICQYVSKKYYTTCFIKKEKYADCEELSSKYANNNKYFF